MISRLPYATAIPSGVAGIFSVAFLADSLRAATLPLTSAIMSTENAEKLPEVDVLEIFNLVR